MNKFLELAIAGVQQLVPYVPGKPVEELQRELGIAEVIKLASNENPLGTGAKVAAAIQATLPELTRYPDGSGFALKAALSAKLKVAPEQITLGNGSSEILELVMRTFVTPELEVVFSQHAFALYPILTQAVGAKAKVVPAKSYGHDLTAMRKQIGPQTRLVFIANPNNPTGTLLDKDELEKFIASLPAHVLCVLDEAYYEFVDPAVRTESLAWPIRYPNLIIARTFSKAYGLAGLRIGYGISSPDIADLLNRVRQPFNCSMLALAAAEAALGDSDYLNQTVALNSAGMAQLTEAFKELDLPWIPSSGNFVSVDVKQAALPIYEALLRKGVIVRPVANYEMPKHLRVSIGTERENAIFINALREVLSGV
ncbi:MULTISPECIES: histidinol-phosphate transaminase [Methylomonas]|uniref:Histidinol-phosphate aminotransferase n=2 Tax=Methylomonas TaxID=416 RepID=A0A140E6F0_9GAMM|nr:MULTISPECIES: histidinol-phosphate transaminase [Methylomonas]AMK78974.1 aspartate aminotransferase [Methylomonas denitrificans]OAH99171.1 histidinol-phosphate transaminase [Methylomonas methanica]TCV77464.1 histidinol-phosphate aminotransferase [Methylomonas methanica]